MVLNATGPKAESPRFFYFFLLFSIFYFFKERLGLKLTHKRITTKVVLPVSRVRVLYRGSCKCVKRGSYDVKLLKSPKVRG